MKKLAFLAALLAAAVAVPLSIGSSHREAPRILKDPTADNTDVWAFTAPDAPRSLTVVANWVPFADPAGGPNFYPLDENARYYVKIDNTGDGYEDVAYRWRFKTRFRNPDSFLYARPTVDSVNDPDVNLVQTYDLYRETYDKHRRLVSVKRIARKAPVVPDNVGPKTVPNFAHVERGGITPLRGGGKAIVAPADDAFFADLGVIFDAVNIDRPGRPNIGLGNQGGGKDDVAGYNTKSFVLQVPESEVTRDGKPVADMKSGNAVVGVWATTERKRMSALRPSGKGKRSDGRDGWVQVSRLGNPLINEVIVPIGKKDKFNATSPADDARNFGRFALNPEPARILNALFGLGIRETNRTDIVQALLTGVPGLTQIGRDPAPADTLKINLGVPPASNPNLRRPGRRHGRVSERPAAHRRRGRHRAPGDRRRALGARPGWEADPARRRRRPERQAVPGAVPVRRPCE
ncbi:MAG: DUF4331 domain-containing protein [Thermoleophilaceae bacterium]|nr:DUF4331 domain-containing protein [Thermoleophilaceae bacterium]